MNGFFSPLSMTGRGSALRCVMLSGAASASALFVSLPSGPLRLLTSANICLGSARRSGSNRVKVFDDGDVPPVLLGSLADPCQWLVFVLAAVYFIVFSVMSSAKYQWFGQGHDLVLHEQAIWNTTQGRIFAGHGLCPSVAPVRL